MLIKASSQCCDDWGELGSSWNTEMEGKDFCEVGWFLTFTSLCLSLSTTNLEIIRTGYHDDLVQGLRECWQYGSFLLN